MLLCDLFEMEQTLGSIMVDGDFFHGLICSIFILTSLFWYW